MTHPGASVCRSFSCRYLDTILARWLPLSVSLSEYENVHVFGSRAPNHVRISIINNTLFSKVSVSKAALLSHLSIAVLW